MFFSKSSSWNVHLHLVLSYWNLKYTRTHTNTFCIVEDNYCSFYSLISLIFKFLSCDVVSQLSSIPFLLSLIYPVSSAFLKSTFQNWNQYSRSSLTTIEWHKILIILGLLSILRRFSLWMYTELRDNGNIYVIPHLILFILYSHPASWPHESKFKNSECSLLSFLSLDLCHNSSLN